MTLHVKTGRISIPTTPALRTFTGVGFRPKAIIFKLTENRTLDDEHKFDSVDHAIGFGFTSGPSDNYCWYALTVTATDVRRVRSSVYCIAVGDTNILSMRVLAALDSFTDDGFVLDVSTALEATYVDYLAIGGDDVTGARAFAFDEPTTTGNFPITGLGIDPVLVVFGDGWTQTTVEVDQRADNSSIRPQLSFLTEAASVSMVCAISPLNNANNTLMTSLRTDNRALVYGQLTSTTPMSLATLASMDVGGFTLNYSVAFAGNGTRRCGIALAGSFFVACGSITEPLTTGTVEVEVPFVPRGGLLMSQGRPDTTTMVGNTTNIEIDNSWGLWAADGGHYTSAWSAYQGTGNELLSAKAQDDTFEVLDQVTTTTANTRSRLSLDGSSSGTARFAFDVVSGSQIEVAYLLFGGLPPPDGGTGVRYRTRRAIG